MDIVCCTDMNYVPYCGVMLTSLLENNRGTGVTVHIIGNELTNEGHDALRRIVEKKYGQQTVFYPLDGKLLDAFPETCSYVSLTAYVKLFIADILPTNIHKALYLDGDLVVVGPLKDLWDYSLDGKAMAAVKDAHRRIEDDCRRLGVDFQREGYFNSGVMLLNLDYWRKNNVLQKALDFLAVHADQLPYHDQDVLNGTLHGQILPLPLRYNLHDCLFHTHRYLQPEDEALVEQELSPEHRVVIHFSSRRKPWGTRCLHPLRKLYFDYQDRTEWSGMRPKDTFKERCWRFNRRLSGWLGWVNGYRRIR